MRVYWLLIALLVAAGARTASAYELKRDDYGFPVRWLDPVVEWRIDDRGSVDLSVERTTRAIKASFSAWAQYLEGIELRFAGLGPVDTVGYDRDAGPANRNMIIFSREDWPFESPTALAMTITTFRQHGKGLVDADIVVNELSYRWRVDGAGDGHSYDLQNTLTHEVGHLLGLAHSDEPEATMFAQAAPSETSKRVLHADDVGGLAALYGPDQVIDPPAAPSGIDPVPQGEVQVTRGGCAQFDLPMSPPAILAGVALLLALMGRRMLALAVIIFSLIGPARASVMEGLSVEAMAGEASVVVEGQVESVEARWAGGLIVSEARVRVGVCHRGDCPEVLRVRTFGGALDGLAQVVEGAARFEPGEQVLVFAAPTPRADVLRVVGLGQGKFRIVDGPAGGWAFRETGGMRLVGAQRDVAEAWHFVALDTLRARLQALPTP